MARHFVSASTQYLERTGVPVAVAPMTLSIWIKTPTPLQPTFCGTLSGAAVNGWFLIGMTNTGDGHARAYQYDGSTPGSIPSTGPALAASTWTHLCAVFTNNSDRACFIGGANKGTQSVAVTTPAVDHVTVGMVYAGGAPAALFDGDLAEFAIWNTALSDAQVAELATGVAATRVGVGSLVAYYPLLGTANPEPDVMGGTPLTVVGASFATHPPIAGRGAGRMFQVF